MLITDSILLFLLPQKFQLPVNLWCFNIRCSECAAAIESDASPTMTQSQHSDLHAVQACPSNLSVSLGTIIKHALLWHFRVRDVGARIMMCCKKKRKKRRRSKHDWLYTDRAVLFMFSFSQASPLLCSLVFSHHMCGLEFTNGHTQPIQW